MATEAYKGIRRGIVKGKPQMYNPQSNREFLKSKLGKASMGEAVKKGARVAGALKWGLLGGAAIGAGALINKAGKDTVKEIEANSKANLEASNKATKKLKEELIKRKKATGKSLLERREARAQAKDPEFMKKFDSTDWSKWR